MAGSFASLSMWPFLYWGRASRGFWQRKVPRTSQALTWLFLLLLFWRLLDHKRTQFSRQLNPTHHLKWSQWWLSNEAPARVQDDFTRDKRKAVQPSPANDHKGTERLSALCSAGQAWWVNSPTFSHGYKVVSLSILYLSCLIINTSVSKWANLFIPKSLLVFWGQLSKVWVRIFKEPAPSIGS